MRPRHHPPWANRGRGWTPGRHVGFRLFGLLLFLLVVAAIVGGIIAWATSSRPLVFLLIGLAGPLLFLLVARVGFRRTWSPIAELLDATTRLGEGDTSIRVRQPGGGPWAEVSRSFNTMAQHLEDEDRRRRRLLADLGHELRTPLTVIRGEIEAVIDGIHETSGLTNVVDEIALMERLLEDLRILALTESGALELRPEPTDLHEIVSDVIASFGHQMETQSVTPILRREGPGGEIEVDPHRSRQVLMNLVANALTAMPSGGTLEVRVGVNTVSVADTGRGIPEAMLGSLFDRFEKASDSKGSGLGLSIARDLVEAHGGTIAASNRSQGGAIFVITLPPHPVGDQSPAT